MVIYGQTPIKSVFLFVIFWGILFIVLSVTMRQTTIGVVMAPIVALLYYLYRKNRVVQVKSIRKNR